MKIIEQINADFLKAYKAKRMEEKDYLGFLKSEVTREEKNPDDAHVVAKLKSMVKKSKDENGVSCLTEVEQETINRYIPSQLSKEDLEVIIGEGMVAFDVRDMSGMGKMMSYLKDNYPGQYDGKLASTTVRELLQN